ncbi:MAG: TetR/AcrR family transcriptional regulator [Imperialibacter sp.]|uniref:TetR/AcrR family transcriptional regulator n=1 Tax=Imperialibacter sp. TaxID=2038411 RepID=UPI0032EB01CD
MRIRDEAKEKLIREKALEMVAKQGFEGLSMQKLAKEAGVSPATIYIYFKDRDDLILQLCREEGTKMIDATFRGFDPEMSFETGLRIQWKNRCRYWLENPMSGQFLEQVKHSPPYEAFFSQDKVFPRLMGHFMTNAIAKKEVIPLPAEVYWSVAFAPLYQLIKFHLSGKGLGNRGPFVLDESKLEMTLSLVLKALKP